MEFANKTLGKPLGYSPIEAGIQTKPEMSEAFKLGLTRSDAMISGLEQDSYINMLFSNRGEVDESLYKEDKEWDREAEKANLTTIHPKLMDSLLYEANNKEHMAAMMPEFEQMSAERRYKESLPWYEDIGMSAVAELTNAPLYLAGSMTAMAAAPATLGVLGTTFAGRALTNGIAGMSIEGLKDIQGKHDKDYVDYLSALVFDGAIGGVFGTKTTGLGKVAVQEMKDTAGITEAVEKQMLEATTNEERKAIAEKAFKDKNDKELSMTGYEQLDAQIGKQGKSSSIWEAARQDLAYHTGKSASPTIEGFSKQMFPDPTLQSLNKDNRDLQTLRDRLEQRMEGDLQSEFQPLIKEFSTSILKSSGWLGIRPSGSAEEAFGNLVGYVQKYKDIAHRTGTDYDLEQLIKNAVDKNGYKHSDELYASIQKGVKAAENIADKYHKKLRESGNTKFQEGGIKESKDFYHFAYDKSKITSLLNKGVKEQDIVKFFESAIASYISKGGKNISPEMTNKAAYMFYKGVSESRPDTEMSFKNIIDDALTDKKLNKEDRDFFESLKEDVPKNSKPDEEVGKGARARSYIDYMHKGSVRGSDGKEIELSIMDLVSDNYFGSMRKYYRQSSGTTALQQMKWVKKLKPLSKEDRLKAIMDSPEVAQITKELEDIQNIKVQLSDANRALEDMLDNILTSEDKDALQKLIDASEADIQALIKKLDVEPEVKARLDKAIEDLKESAGLIKTPSEYMNKMSKLYSKKSLTTDDIASLRTIKEEITAKYGDEVFKELSSISKKLTSGLRASGKNMHSYVKGRLSSMGIKDARTKKYKEAYEKEYVKYKEENKFNYDQYNKLVDELEAKHSIGYKQQTEEARTLSTNQDIRDFEQQIVDDLREQVSAGTISEKEMNKELVRVTHILKDMQGVPTAKDPDSFAHTAQRLIGSFNIFRLLGQTGFTMSAEAASVMLDGGMKNMLKTMPEFGRIMKAYKTGKLDDPFLVELQEETGMLTEFLSSPRAHELSHDFSPNGWDGFAKKAQDTVDSMAEFTLMMGGIKPMSAMFRVAHAKGIFTKMKDVANGKAADDTYFKMLNELGLSKESTEKIYGNILANTTPDSKMMNFNKWDTETKNLFMDGVVRRSDTIIQQKRLGDTMAWVTGDHLLQSSAMGKFLMELKTFSLVAYTKQLGRVINRGDLHTSMLVASWTAALSLSYMAKAHYNYAGNKEKLDAALEPSAMFKSVVGQIPLASIIPEVANTVGTATGLGAPFGHSRHSGVATDFMSVLPSVDLINNIGKSVAEPVKGLIDGEVKPHHFAPIAKTLGAKNNMILRPFTEHLLQD